MKRYTMQEEWEVHDEVISETAGTLVSGQEEDLGEIELFDSPQAYGEETEGETDIGDNVELF